MIDAQGPHSQYLYGTARAPMMSDYVTMPISSTSPTAFYTPLVNVESQQHTVSPQSHYSLPNFNQSWPPAMSRFLPSPPVKIEPLETGPDDHYQTQHGYAVGNDSNNRYISGQVYRTPSYHGRLHLQAPSSQLGLVQQQPTFTSQNGYVSNMTPAEQTYYHWQSQQQRGYQSSRSSLSSTMLDHLGSDDSVATMAPLDMKPSSPASSVSEGNGNQALADVSITLHPWTTQVQNPTLYTSTTCLSSLGTFGTVQGTDRFPSPPLASIHWSSDDDPILPIAPPVAALSLREVQCQSSTNWSDPLQHDSDSEHNVSDSEDDADHSDDDDAPHEIHHEHDEYDHDHDHDHDHDNDQLVEINQHTDLYDKLEHGSHERDKDEHDNNDDDSSDDDDEEHAYPPTQIGNRVASLLDMPAATSNLRNEPASGVKDLSKLQSRLPVFPTAVLQRAAAKVATKRISALTRPSTPDIEVKPEPKQNSKKKRPSKPRAPRKTSGKKRPLAVTSAAISRVPAPIVDFNINKKSRGRTVTTDPNEVDSNIVHVCPVPTCGACFKRREHVKRHIRGLHTEDKPYECMFPDCQSTFTRGDNLKGHYVKVHKTTIDKLYKRLGLPLTT